MPKIPVYGEQKVQAQGLPSARAPIDAPIEAFGGGRANPMGDVANALGDVSKFAFEEAKRQNNLRNQILKNKVDEFKAKEYKEGFFTKKGQDALNDYEGFNKRWESYRQEISKEAHNDVQRNFLDAYSQDAWNKFSLDAAIHQNKEEELVRSETEKAAVGFAYDEMERSYVDNKRLDASLAQIQQSVENLYSHLPEDVKGQKYFDTASKGVYLAFERAVKEGNIGRAEAIKDRYKQHLRGMDTETILKAEKESQSVLAAANKIFSENQFTNKYVAKSRIMDMYKNNPEFGEKVYKKVEADIDLLNDSNAVEQTKNNLMAVKEAVETGRISAVTNAKLDARGLKLVQQAIDLKSKKKNFVEIPKEFESYLSSSQEVLASLRDDEALSAVIGLPKEQQSYFIEKYAAAKAGMNGEKAKQYQFNMTEAIEKQVFEEMKMLGSIGEDKAIGKLDAKERALFYGGLSKISTALQEETRAKGSQLTDEEIRTKVSSFVRQRVPSFEKTGILGFGNEVQKLKPLYNIEPDTYVPTDRQRFQVVRSFRQLSGSPLTEKQIQEKYRKEIRKTAYLIETGQIKNDQEILDSMLGD